MTAPINLTDLDRLIAAAKVCGLYAGGAAEEKLTIAAFNALPALIAELRDARRDAERYRWLRDNRTGPGHPVELFVHGCSPSNPDAAIDAAIAASAREGER